VVSRFETMLYFEVLSNDGPLSIPASERGTPSPTI